MMKNNKQKIGIIVLVFFILMIFTGIIMLTKKTEKKVLNLELNYEDNTQKMAYAKFEYPKKSWEAQQDENVISIENKEKNYMLNLTLLDELETTYNEIAEEDKEFENYKEEKFGKYKGYSYKYGDTSIAGRILLKQFKESESNIFIEFEITPTNESIAEQDIDITSIFNSREVQRILKSFKYSEQNVKGSKTEDETEIEYDEELNDDEEIVPLLEEDENSELEGQDDEEIEVEEVEEEQEESVEQENN